MGIIIILKSVVVKDLKIIIGSIAVLVEIVFICDLYIIVYHKILLVIMTDINSYFYPFVYRYFVIKENAILAQDIN